LANSAAPSYLLWTSCRQGRRGVAMIQTDQGMFLIEEIEKLYKKIKP
jgi:hypothetical protein